MTDTGADAERLRALFAEHADRVLAYASRHVDSHTAHDVVSEVFLTAWRRLSVVPDEPLPWLLVTARNTIHNRTRGAYRQRRLAQRIELLDSLTATSPAADDAVLERQAMIAALAQLSDPEREALLLTAWDGLSAAAASVVAGCSRHAFEVRLNRTRARLRRALDEPEPARRPRLVHPVHPAQETS